MIIFEVSKRVDSSQRSCSSENRRSAVIVQRALSPSHRSAKGDRGWQKQKSTYVRSVPLRGGEDTTDSVASKGVSFRVVFGTSITPGVVYLPVRSACLYLMREGKREYRETYRTIRGKRIQEREDRREDASVTPACSPRPNRAVVAR